LEHSLKIKSQSINRMNFRLHFLVGALVLLAGCSPKIPFTQSVREKHNLTAEELRRIQFYLSDPVILRRGNSQSEKATEEGALVIKSGKNIEQVSFKANTPGTVSEVVSNSAMKISFEDGPEKMLVFSSDKNGYYALKALSWERDGKGTINYGGQTYTAAPGSSNAILLFKMKSLKDVQVKERW
jgi:hypothetical protein